jgi:hypothetical protein
MDALTEWLTMTLAVMTGIIFVKLALSVVRIPVVSDLAAMV